MSSKKVNVAPTDATEETAVETVVETATETTTPVAVESKQKGRPVLTGSARQARLLARAERAASNGGTVSLGRPVNPTSARAIKIANRQARIDAGIVVKPGRPKAEKSTVLELEIAQ
jgi:hypothetical protein